MPSLTTSPTSGYAGVTQFEVTVTGFTPGAPGAPSCSGRLNLSFQAYSGEVYESWTEPSPTKSPETYGSFIVPRSAQPAVVKLKASCHSAASPPSTLSAVRLFVVDARPITSPATTPSNAPPTTTTTAAAAAAAAPPTTQTLALSRDTISPKGRVTASGHGCTPNVPVLITINGGAIIGGGRTDDNGSFTAPLQVRSLPVGHYRIDAHCGPQQQLVSDLSIADITQNPPKRSDPPTPELVIVGVVLLGIIAVGVVLFRTPRGRHSAAKTRARGRA